MHKNEYKFNLLLAKQPLHLSYIQKLNRIDRLACFELQSEILINFNLSHFPFLSLVTIIDYEYARLLPVILQEPTFHESLLYNAYLSSDKILDKLPSKSMVKSIVEFCEIRREVISLISSLCQ
jgi:hypothetical protein